MKEDYYMHQRFLLECDYENVSLIDSFCPQDEFIQNFTEPVNLFDIDDEITRKVKISYLLKEIDTEEDLNNFLKKVDLVDTLIIENDVNQSTNKIIAEYQKATLKAFIKRSDRHLRLSCAVL